MDFTFGDSEDDKKDDKKVGKKEKELDLLSDTDDLTAGLDDATCRKLLNVVGRAAAHMLLASTLLAERFTRQEHDIDPITAVVFKSHMRHAMKYLGTIMDDDNPHRLVVPIYRI